MMSKSKISRNDPCPCGSGKKYKQCCQTGESLKVVSNPQVEVSKLIGDGLAFHRGGMLPQAAGKYHEVLRLQPKNVQALGLLGSVALIEHKIEDAISLLQRALKIQPNNPELHSNLALALQFDGDIPLAIDHCRQATKLDPSYTDAWYNLHALLVNDSDLQPAIKCIKRVLTLNPRDDDARLLLGVMLDYSGDEAEAEIQFSLLNKNSRLIAARRDAWQHIKSKMNQQHPIKIIGSRIHAFEIGIGASNAAGLIMEFGVRNGNSIRKIASMTDDLIHGFDSFEGLPEAWHHEPKGSYSTEGQIPEVPSNVKLHVGWFDKTLPEFMEKYPDPVRFINIDCDIYSSTKTILTTLAPRIVRGSVILFDEYIGNEHWREDEFKAFQEAVAEFGWKYEYLCFSLFTKQTVVRITEAA